MHFSSPRFWNYGAHRSERPRSNLLLPRRVTTPVGGQDFLSPDKDHFGDPAPILRRGRGQRKPSASDWRLLPAAGLELLRREPGSCGDARASLQRWCARSSHGRAPPLHCPDWRHHPKGRALRRQCWCRVASVWCDLCPAGGSSCLRPSHSHGGLASATARTSRGAEGKEGPDGRPGARGAPRVRGRRGKTCGLTVTSSRPGMPLTPLPGSGAGPGVRVREPGLGGLGARHGSDDCPGDPGQRPLWTPIPRRLRCAARPRTGVGAAGVPRGAPPAPLRTVSLLFNPRGNEGTFKNLVDLVSRQPLRSQLRLPHL